MDPLTTLVTAAKGGDKDAFGHIVRRFQDMAYATAYTRLGDPYQAQDAAQDAFIDAYTLLNDLREPAAFPGWFRRIVLKHTDRQVRTQRSTVSTEVLADLPSHFPDPLTLIEDRQTQETVQDAVAALPERQRLVTTLFHLEGYSQKEVATFLELPVSTVKKRLFDARKRLKKRMFKMAQKTVQQSKPSNDDQFANRVQFFIALQSNDLDQVQSLLKKEPDLVRVEAQWADVPSGHFWPLGVTPLFWAASTGNRPLVDCLLKNGADVNAVGKSGQTPLHYVARIGDTDMVAHLIDKGAQVDTASQNGHTPLHHAVLKNNRAMVEQLLNHSASVTLKDKRGYTPADWAAIEGYDDLVDCLGGAPKPATSLQSKSTSAPKKRTVPPASAALGRILNANGEPIDDLGPLSDATPEPLHRPISDLPSPILETGIKIIDLFAPLKRGGQVAIFTPLAGVGRRLLLGQLITSMAIRHNGCIVYLGLEDDTYKPRELILEWQAEFGMDDRVVRERMVHLFAHANDSTAQKQRVVETGLSFAEHLRRQGNEVLLVLENPLALTEGVIPYLKAHTSCTPESAITTLYDADHTPDAEPRAYAHLDAIITFNMDRAREGLYPAIDPLESRSTLLSSELIDPNHTELVSEIKRLFKRYQGLHYMYEYRRSDGFFYLDDPKAGEQTAIRARRLHRFLTQPYHGGEPWTGIPGVWVSLEETLQGCREILEGKHDDLPENAFKFIGTIDQVDATAKEINQSIEKAGRGRG